MSNTKIITRFLTFFIVAFAVVCLTACGENNPGKTVWDRFVSAINNADELEVAKTIYSSESSANAAVENGDIANYLNNVANIKTVSYKTLAECDFSNELGTEVYYQAEVTAYINISLKYTFCIYSYNGNKGSYLCSLPEFDDPENLGNTPNDAWYKKAYFTNDSFLYQVVPGTNGKDSTITISGQNKNEKEVIIPNEIDGYSVTKIGDYAFYQYNKIISFTTKTSKMKSLTLPNTIETIGKYAFYQCGKLKELVIPQSVKTIETNAFASCSKLKKITLNIDDSDLYNDDSNDEVVGTPAVGGYNSIAIKGGKRMNAGDIITLSIESDNITLDRVKWSVNSEIAVLSTDERNQAVIYAKGSGTVTVTATYRDNPSITATLTLTFNKVTTSKTIDCSAFDRCYGLEELIITAINPNSIVLTGDKTSFNLNDDVIIYVPKGSKSMYENHTMWSSFASQIRELDN